MFHSLRHTCGINPARGGVASRMAMSVMRHSERRLTNKVDTDENLLDTSGAIDSLPNYGERASQIASQILGATSQNGSSAVTMNGAVATDKTLENIGQSHVLTLTVTRGQKERNGGSGGARTRNLCRDRAAL